MDPWLKKYTWLVYNENFVYCKICTKAKKSNGLSKESQGRNFRILRFFNMLVFKNTKWPTCLYMLFVPKGTLGLTHLGLGLCESQSP